MRSEASRLLSLVTEYESNANGAQVNDQTRLDAVVASAGTLTQLTGAKTYGNFPEGTPAAGDSRLVIGTCSGTTATAAAGVRTYALEFVLQGNQRACIQS